MTIWIVLKNGEVDEVFYDFGEAERHRLQLQEGWNLAKIIKRKVNK